MELFANTLITVGIAFAFNFFLKIAERLINKKPIDSEALKNDAEARQKNAQTIENITQSYQELSGQLIDVKKDNVTLSEQLVEIKRDNACLEDKLTSALSEIADLRKEVQDVVKENAELKIEVERQRMMTERERALRIRLREGIDVLIGQLESVRLSPLWKPDTSE